MEKFLKLAKPIALWAATVLLAVLGIVFLPSLGGFAALVAAVLILPVPKWQELIRKVLDSRIQVLIAIVLVLLAFTGAPSLFSNTEGTLPPVTTEGTSGSTAGTTEPTQTTADHTTSSSGTTAPSDATEPSTEPSAGTVTAPNTGILSSKLTDGDNVVIYFPADGTVITAKGYTYTGSSGYTKEELELAAGTLDGTTLRFSADAVVLTVNVSGSNYTFVTGNGKYLYADGSNVQFVDQAGEHTQFVLEPADSGYYIKCANATYNDKAQYLEVYKEYLTCYGLDEAKADIYTFQFYQTADAASDIGNVTSGGNTSGGNTSGGTTDESGILKEEPASYDYAVNTNSKKIHHPTCESVSDMKTNGSKNLGFYVGTIEELEAMGYTRCGTCNGEAVSSSGGDSSGGSTSGGNTSGGTADESGILKEEPASYDYAVNTNSKKIHHPTCKSVSDMKTNGSKNLGFYVGTIEELEAMGYTRCGTCNGEAAGSSGGDSSGGNTSGGNTSGGNTSGGTTDESGIVKEEPASYDYVVNTSSKKIHHPSCSSVEKTSDKNKGYFSGTIEELEAMGYTRCGTCNGEG